MATGPEWSAASSSTVQVARRWRSPSCSPGRPSPTGRTSSSCALERQRPVRHRPGQVDGAVVVAALADGLDLGDDPEPAALGEGRAHSGSVLWSPRAMLTRKLKAVNGPATTSATVRSPAGLHQPDRRNTRGWAGATRSSTTNRPASAKPSGFTEPSATTRKASLGTAPANAPAGTARRAALEGPPDHRMELLVVGLEDVGGAAARARRRSRISGRRTPTGVSDCRR